MRSFRNQQVAGSNPASSSTKKRLILVGIGRFSHWGGSRFLGERRAKESCQDGVNLLIAKGNNNMGLEERCEALLGKQVRITFRDGSQPMCGVCVGYARAADNEPEIAEIDIDTGAAGAYYGLMENEIEAIEELSE